MKRFLTKFFGRPSRLDHGRMYVCIMFGLFIWSMSLLTIGPIPNSVIDELTDYTQIILSLCIFVGSSVCIVGIFIGTRFIPWIKDIRLAFKFALWGMPAIVGSVGTYVWAVINNNESFWASAYGSAIGSAITLGILWNGLDFASDLIRLQEGVKFLREEETSRTDDGSGQDADRDDH